MRYIKNKKFFFLLILLVGIIISFDAAALEVSWPTSPMNTEFPTSSISTLVKYFYDWGIALGGLAAFISLVIAGFLYLTSVGNPAKMQAAKDRAVWAIGGLALLLGSWLILNTINPELTTFRLPPTNLMEIGQLECDTITDCPPSTEYEYQCSDPCPNECATTTGCISATPPCKEGICEIKKKKEVACTKAKVFDSPGYEGNSDDILLNHTGVLAGNWIPGGGREILSFPPESVKVYAELTDVMEFAPNASPTTDAEGKVDCCSEDAQKNGYFGCKCYLQVFHEPSWAAFWKTCGQMESIVPGCEKRIVDYTDISIGCAKPTQSSW